MSAAALLRAVLDAPDDDVPRLVYADWLDEHGDEAARARANLIRVQCSLARLTDSAPEREALERRERELLAGHAAAWLAGLPTWAVPRGQLKWAAGKEGRDVEEHRWARFRRGFLDGVCAPSARELHRHADALWAAEPVTDVYIGDPDGLTQWRHCPHLARVAGLRFSHHSVGPIEAVDLANLPNLTGLRELDLYRSEARDRGVRALANSPALAGLRVLELTFNDVHAAGARALIASPYLTRLEYLGLEYNPLAPRTRAALRERFGDVVYLGD
jgi:uncharacterized protein (TIGR02996 family)